MKGTGSLVSYSCPSVWQDGSAVNEAVLINLVHLSDASFLLTGVNFILKQTQMYYRIKCKNHMRYKRKEIFKKFCVLGGPLLHHFLEFLSLFSTSAIIGISVENCERH